MVLLYREAQQSPFFWLEYVHITGSLGKKINLKHISFESYKLSRTGMNEILNGGNTDRNDFLLGPYHLQDGEIEGLYNYTKSRIG